MKMSDLLEAAPALKQFAATKLPGATAARVSRALRDIQKRLTTFEEDRMALAERFGTMSEDKKQYRFEGDGLTEFNKGMAELLDEEVPLSIKPISVAELGECVIEPMHMTPLLDIFGFAE